jgi:hypothetical protein
MLVALIFVAVTVPSVELNDNAAAVTTIPLAAVYNIFPTSVFFIAKRLITAVPVPFALMLILPLVISPAMPLLPQPLRGASRWLPGHGTKVG